MKKFNEYEVIIYKKKGAQAHSDKVVLKECITSISISKKEDTSTAEARVEIEYENVPKAIFAGGNHQIIDNFAKIEIYINKKIQFTGVIKCYTQDSESKIMSLTCHDMYYRLNNTLENEKKWYDVKATTIIQEICKMANLELHVLGGEDYLVKKLECSVGTTFHDIIYNLVETMYAKIRCGKDGIILLEYQYPPYIEEDHSLNRYDFEYISNRDLKKDNWGRDATRMKNIIQVKCNNKYTIYESPSMTKYLNGERWVEQCENPLATTEKLRQKVAGQKFLDMWRESTSINIEVVKGEIEQDLGKVIKLKSIYNYSGYYLVVGLDVSISSDGYFDTLQLRGMRDCRKVYTECKKIGQGFLKES